MANKFALNVIKIRSSLFSIHIQNQVIHIQRDTGRFHDRLFLPYPVSVKMARIPIILIPNPIPLPISALSPGAYFVQAILPNGELQRGSFVKEQR
jgi:hypothetical protein